MARFIDFCYLDLLNIRKVKTWGSDDNRAGYSFDDGKVRIWMEDDNTRKTIVIPESRVEYIRMIER